MKLITKSIDKEIRTKILVPAEQKDFETASKNTIEIQEKIYDNIPSNKKSSYGIVHTIRILSRCIAKHLTDKEENLLNIGTGIYSQSKNDIGRGVALGILSEYGKEDFANTSPFFISAAASKNWKLREFTQMFFRKLITANPGKAKELLLETTKTNNPRLRRFVSESLRPLQENKWINKNPEYSLSILKNMYQEAEEYPRNSVSKNLSDLSKQNPELILEETKKLVKMNDTNAYLIAYGACRNLVKDYPHKVMNILGVDEYKYKNRKYLRSNFTSNKQQQ